MIFFQRNSFITLARRLQEAHLPRGQKASLQPYFSPISLGEQFLNLSFLPVFLKKTRPLSSLESPLFKKIRKCTFYLEECCDENPLPNVIDENSTPEMLAQKLDELFILYNEANEETSIVLSKICNLALLTIFDNYFWKKSKRETGMQMLEQVLYFAKAHSLTIELPEKILEDGLGNFSLVAAKQGAVHLLEYMQKESPSVLTSKMNEDFLPNDGNPLLIAIQYHQQEVTHYLLDKAFHLIEEEAKKKKALFFCIQFDNEPAFDALTPRLGEKEFNKAVIFSLGLHDAKYLRKLIALGAKLKVHKRQIRNELFAICCILHSTEKKEELEQLISLLLTTQIAPEHREKFCNQLKKKLLWIEAQNVPSIIYRVRTDPSFTAWGAFYGGEHIQQFYDEEFRKTVIGGILLIKQGIPFESLMQFFAEKRKRIACLANHTDSEFFGLWRTSISSSQTPLAGRYEKYLHKVKQKILQGQIDGFAYARISKEGAKEEVQAQFTGIIDGENILLTKIAKGDSGNDWIHTECAQRDKIIEYVTRLYEEIVNTQIISQEDLEFLSYKQEIAKKIIAIHWWMAHATPYWRGSAAITEMLIRSLLSYHHIHTTPWKIGAIADCEALTSSLISFIEQYADLMEPGYSPAITFLL